MPASKVNSKIDLKKIGSICLLVNGFIFLFYALTVPTFVQGVHWLITLAAILFIVALPAIYYSLLRVKKGRVRKGAVKIVVALFGVAMLLIILSDLLFVVAFLSALNHDFAYAAGNMLFIICLLAIGVMALKGAFFKWFGYLSIIAAVIGLSTYIPQAVSVLSTVSLLLIGLWSLAFGFNISKLVN